MSHPLDINLLRNCIRDVRDFPRPGIVFKDITPVLADPLLCKSLLHALVLPWMNQSVDAVAGIESRGFLFGLSMAQELNVPFIPIRKEGKLPAKTISERYELEYGFSTLEMHEDALNTPQHVLIHDDLLATGGTASAARSLIVRAGGDVAGFSFIIELDFLDGRKSIGQPGLQVCTLLNYS